MQQPKFEIYFVCNTDLERGMRVNCTKISRLHVRRVCCAEMVRIIQNSVHPFLYHLNSLFAAAMNFLFFTRAGSSAGSSAGAKIVTRVVL